MHALARERLWMLDLAAVALCAVLLGRAASTAVDLRLLRLPAPPDSPSALPRPAPAPGRPSGAREIIVDRNIFCSGCPAAAASNSEGEAGGGGPQRSQLPLDLVAVNQLVSRGRARDSTAVLRDRDSKAVGAFTSGDRVREALIVRIDQTRVHLLNDGREEYLDLLEAAAGSTGPPSGSSDRGGGPPAEPASGISQELEGGIRKVGERSYEIRRSTLEGLLGNMNLLARSARIVPEIRDGRAAGFRFHAVVPQGPFAKIGVQSGDVIASINGLELTSPEKGFEVYGKLRSASHLSLELERGGKRMVIDYSVR